MQSPTPGGHPLWHPVGMTPQIAEEPRPLTAQEIASWEPLFEGTLLPRMGMRILELGAAGGTMTMPVAGNTQPAGLLHGGATIALAETVASMAAILHARAVHGGGAQAVGTSVSAVHHRSAREGTVTARARGQHRGRRVATYLVEILDEQDRLLSTVTVSAMLQPPHSGGRTA